MLFCRGIDVVRNKIKMFAQQKLTLPKSRHKIIILDEADRSVLLCNVKYRVYCSICNNDRTDRWTKWNRFVLSIWFCSFQ